jgi:hypothetical protein
MDELVNWLRSKGALGKSPLHALRKEYGSQVNNRHGIYEASRALRHADINITTQHYIRNTKRIAPGLGHLLKGAENVVSIGEPERRRHNLKTGVLPRSKGES